MKTVKMKNEHGELYPRVPIRDISQHLKNGWELVEEKPKKSTKPAVVEPKAEVDLDLDLTEENE